MAIAKYIQNNKKKSAYILAGLLLISFAIFMYVRTMNIKAGVFINDEDGEKVQTNNINILEIYADQGQQVLGYTVAGSEPITKEQIESYKGEDIFVDSASVEDFKDATGYIVEKVDNGDGTTSYKVTGNVLNNTFNDNVLNGSMAPGELKVTAMQAKDVKISDVKNANLIFINSNNYNSNLLYYYDKFACNGELGYIQGYIGKDYDYSEMTTELKSSVAIKKIASAAGNKTLAYQLTMNDFNQIESLSSLGENILPLLQKIIVECDKEAFYSEYEDETLALIEEKLFIAIDEEKTAAFEYIRDNVAGKDVIVRDGDSEEVIAEKTDKKDKFLYYLTIGGWSDVIEENIDFYCEQILGMTNGVTQSGVQSAITNGNAEALIEAVKTIYQYKGEVSELRAAFVPEDIVVEEGQEPQQTVFEIPEEYKQGLYVLFVKMGNTEIRNSLVNYYAEYIFSDEFEMTDPETVDEESTVNYVNTAKDEVNTAINTINTSVQSAALERIAGACANAEMLENLKSNAKTIFIEAYVNELDETLIEKYVERIETFTNVYQLKTFVDGVYEADINKIQAQVIDAVNAENVRGNTDVLSNYDLSWDVAMAIYDYALEERAQGYGALMYDTQLLTNKGIGDYEDVASLENTNNLYKLLLLSRQLKSDYFYSEIKDKIDGSGVYYAEGLDEKGQGIGEGVASFNVETFGTDYDNKNKYHEPNVVGATYLDDGSDGQAVNYIYKHTYSFTGDEFFGGKSFVYTEITGDIIPIGVASATDTYEYYGETGITVVEQPVTTNTKTIYLDASAYGWRTAKIRLWKQNYNETVVEYDMTALGNNQFSFTIKDTVGYNMAIFRTGNQWSDTTATIDTMLPTDWDGMEYYLAYNNSSVNGNLSNGGRIRCYVLDQYDTNTYGTANYLYLDVSKFGWRGNIEAEFIWDRNGNGWLDRKTVRMTAVNSETNLYTCKRQNSNYQYVIFKCNGQQTEIIKLSTDNNPKNDLYTLQYVDNGTWASQILVSTNRYANKYYKTSSFYASNSIENEEVVFSGNLDVQYIYKGLTNVTCTVNGNPVGIYNGYTLKLGRGTEYTGVERITVEIKFKDAKGNDVTKVYYYKLTDTTSIVIENFSTENVIQYYTKMEMPITYKNMESVMYCFNNDGNWKDIASGSSISIGEGIASETDTKVTVIFKEVGKSDYISVTCTVNKLRLSIEDEAINYLSIFSASSKDTSARINDPTGKNSMMTKGDIIRYIMDVVFTQYSYPIKILEIQPNVGYSEFDSTDGAKKLATMLHITDIKDYSKYKDYFKIKTVSIREFNGRLDDLTANYDLIYIGADPGYMLTKKYNNDGIDLYRTIYRDSTMNGLVYTGIGDKYKVSAALRGAAKTDYTETTGTFVNYNVKVGANKDAGNPKVYTDDWKNYFFDGYSSETYMGGSWYLDKTKTYVKSGSDTTTRLVGNDLTVRAKDRLLDYLKAGYPILVADEIMYCDSDQYIDATGATSDVSVAKKWRYVDLNSKMYGFIKEAKALGRSNTGIYDGKDSQGNQVFEDGKTYASLVSVKNAKNGGNPEYLDASVKTEGGLVFAMNRTTKIEYTVLEKPTEYTDNKQSVQIESGVSTYTGTTIARTSDEYKHYRFKLKVDTKVSQKWLEENYVYQVGIDKSGTGRFNDDDVIMIDPSVTYEKSDDGTLYAIVSGDWPTGIEGFIPWKLMAYNYNSPSIRFTYEGYSSFEFEQKKDVYVLWVKTEHSGTASNLDFATRVNDYKNYIKEYNIHIVTMKYSEFSNMWKDYSGDTVWYSSRELEKDPTLANKAGYKESLIMVDKVCTTLKNNNHSNFRTNMTKEEESLHKDFDMIVFGFADSYEGEDVNYYAAQTNIDYFVNSINKSLLYSHDNTSYYSSLNFYTSTSGSTDGATANYIWARYNTAYMRSMLGMDFYGISENPDNLSVEAKKARSYIDIENYNQEDFRGFTEETAYKEGKDKDNAIYPYATELHGQDKYKISDWVHTTTVKKINKGQLTEYPFILSDTIPTGTTHSQYMTLNLEADDITVWFALTASSGLYNRTDGDCMSNYYIYSKGNITYTGSGHENNISSTEVLLFINTVVAALKIGNFAPTMELPYSYDVDYEYTDASGNKVTETRTVKDYYPDDPDSEGVEVVFKATDYDALTGAADCYSKCLIYVDLNKNGVFDDGDIVLNDSNTFKGTHTSQYISNGSEPITIRANEIKNKENVSFFILKDDIEAIATANKLGDEWLYEYPIVISVTDTGSKNKANSESDDQKSLYIVKKEYIAPDLFKLN